MHSRMAASSRAALSAATWKSRTLWVRSALATLGMAGLSGSLMGFDQALTMTGLKPGPVHVAMFLAFVPLAAWWMHTIYGLHNKWAGLSILLLFVFVPGLLLVLLKLIFGVEALHWIDVREWINEIPR
jgi:hypothetical protein